MPFTTFHSLRLLLLGLTLCAGCTQRMADQPRYDPLQRSELFADLLSARPIPPGTIPRSFTDPDELLDTGMKGGQLADEFPFAVTIEVLQRGRQRYDIYCTPCHDYVGSGNGMAARRGFKRFPPSFHIERMRTSPAGHFFDVISNGFGAMEPYANQLVVRDRWAIVAYIRALQMSQWTTISDVPDNERSRLEQEPR